MVRLILIILFLLHVKMFVLSAKVVEVGLITPLTRQDKTTPNPWGIYLKNGFDLAFSYSKHFSFTTKDSSASAMESKLAAKQLVDQNVGLIVGSIFSKQARMIQTETRKAKVPFLSVMASSEDLFAPNSLTFSMALSNRNQAVKLSNYLEKFWPKTLPREIAVITARNCIYCVDLERELLPILKKKRFKTINYPDILQRRPVPSKYFQKLKPHQAIAILANETEATSLIKNLYDSGFKGMIIGGDSWSIQSLQVQSLGKPPLGICMVNAVPYDMNHSSQKSRIFLKAYREKYHHDPIDVAALAYDAGFVVDHVFRKCAKSDKQKECVLTVLTTLRLNGVTGKILFDKTGKRRDHGFVISAGACG